MFLQSWQMVAILVGAFVFGFGIGRTFGESRAWAKMDKAQSAFNAVPSYVEQQAATFARDMMAGLDDEGEIPIVYEESDALLHTAENNYRCGQRYCPCMVGHIVDGRIIVEQEIS